MTRSTYELFENYMLSCAKDSAHDKEHIYRVLFHAMQIAKQEAGVDYDVLICACLLHDIGRPEQFANPKLCHAEIGAEKAKRFLLSHGYAKGFVEQVAHCILCHRYRNGNVPQTLEAKILFDADKLDATGAMGIARTLVYKGQVSEPLYNLNTDGTVSNGEKDIMPSFFQEYKYKLEKVYDRFYTEEAKKMARQYQEHAVSFYEDLLAEVTDSYEQGNSELENYFEKGEDTDCVLI
ncbi:MAG: HD domain-containing protein [Lachnospiraceae bacterium]|nr:HD domain-containing protein [Lachnospiraceae bacterium]